MDDTSTIHLECVVVLPLFVSLSILLLTTSVHAANFNRVICVVIHVGTAILGRSRLRVFQSLPFLFQTVHFSIWVVDRPETCPVYIHTVNIVYT